MTPDQIRAALTELGLSQRRLATLTALDDGLIRSICRGDHAIPRWLAGWLAECVRAARRLPPPPPLPLGEGQAGAKLCWSPSLPPSAADLGVGNLPTKSLPPGRNAVTITARRRHIPA